MDEDAMMMMMFLFPIKSLRDTSHESKNDVANASFKKLYKIQINECINEIPIYVVTLKP